MTFSSTKDAINRRKHGISLGRTEDFDFETALYDIDDREDYGETRYRARLYALVFTQTGESIRPISLRKATPQERKRYAEAL